MSKEALEFLYKINPSFKNIDIDNTNTFGGKFLIHCLDKALKQGFTPEQMKEAYRDGWNDSDDSGGFSFDIKNY